MNLRLFIASVPGRITTATVGFAMLGVSLLAMLGPDAPRIQILSFIPLVCIAGFIMSIGLAIEEHAYEALALVLGLPFVGGFYLAGLFVVMGAGTWVASAFLVVGLIPLTSAAWPRRTLIERSNAPSA